MKKDIKYVFHLQVALLAVSVIIVLLSSTVFIHGRYQKEKTLSDFDHELSLTANNFYHKILTAEEYLQALSSRSMIRDSLYQLSLGEKTIEETRAYTQPKYADGAGVYANIIYARRIDEKQRIIADYPPGNPGNITFPSRNISFFHNDKGCHIVLSNPIVQNDRTIGWDQAVFFLCDFPDEEFNLLKSVSVVDSEVPLEKKRHIGEEVSETIPLGDTGYFLYGELNKQGARDESLKNLRLSVIQASLIILLIALLTYFTIMRIMIRLIREQERAYDKALRQEKEATISQIIAGLAHEINNVLTGIFGLSDSLELMTEFPDEGRPLLENLRDSSSRMADFMKKLTDYSRHNLYGKGEANLKEALEKIIKDGKLPYPQVKISLISPMEDLIINMGMHHLEQVVSNLLENASEAMGGAGEIILTIDKKRIAERMGCPHCSSDLKRSWIRLRVADRGKGIPTELVPRVFDPFFSSRADKEGLGLAQATGIITRYEGHIFVEKTSPEGTVITILFPDPDSRGQPEKKETNPFFGIS